MSSKSKAGIVRNVLARGNRSANFLYQKTSPYGMRILKVAASVCSKPKNLKQAVTSVRKSLAKECWANGYDMDQFRFEPSASKTGGVFTIGIY